MISTSMAIMVPLHSKLTTLNNNSNFTDPQTPPPLNSSQPITKPTANSSPATMGDQQRTTPNI